MKGKEIKSLQIKNWEQNNSDNSVALFRIANMKASEIRCLRRKAHEFGDQIVMMKNTLVKIALNNAKMYYDNVGQALKNSTVISLFSNDIVKGTHALMSDRKTNFFSKLELIGLVDRHGSVTEKTTLNTVKRFNSTELLKLSIANSLRTPLKIIIKILKARDN